MKMIQQINNALNDANISLQESVNITSINCTNMLSEDCIIVCEHVVNFLSNLESKLNLGKKINISDRHTRNLFGILAAVDMLRYPQARKSIDVNTINKFLDIMVNIGDGDELSAIDVKLLNNLRIMKNDEGETGFEKQTHYMLLAMSHSVVLTHIIDKLHKQYSQMMNKLYRVSTRSTPTSDKETAEYNEITATG